jgi:putative Ca2+/H+ antiporter (TMEM165/GDT1 family)
MSLEPLVVSTAIVAAAEMGDKTQLLSFVLAAKLKRPVPIVLGILVATLANHFLAGWIGAWLATLVSPRTLKWVIGASFVVFGLWTLKPDELEDDRKLRGSGVFLTTLLAFFLVEMGDKTQLATVALAARYQSLALVVAGTTLGMMIANVPAVWIGEALAHRINMKWMRWTAAALFVLLGVLTLFAGDDALRVERPARVSSSGTPAGRDPGPGCPAPSAPRPAARTCTPRPRRSCG